MKYQKMLKTVVFTLHDKSEVTVADTAEKQLASSALAQFEAEKAVKVVGEDNTTLIPYHAIIKAVITETQTEIEKGEDAFCNAVECDCKQEETPASEG